MRGQEPHVRDGHDLTGPRQTCRMGIFDPRRGKGKAAVSLGGGVGGALPCPDIVLALIPRGGAQIGRRSFKRGKT